MNVSLSHVLDLCLFNIVTLNGDDVGDAEIVRNLNVCSLLKIVGSA